MLLIGSIEAFITEHSDRFEADSEIMDVLKKRSDFLTAAQGKRWHSPSMVVQMVHTPALQSTQNNLPRSDSDPRVGFTVTKRVGNAVVRNRVRRRLRAAARQIVPEYGHAGRDYVLIGRKAALDQPFECLLDDLKGALIKLEQSKRTSRRSKGKSSRDRNPSQTQS